MVGFFVEICEICTELFELTMVKRRKDDIRGSLYRHPFGRYSLCAINKPLKRGTFMFFPLPIREL